MNAAVSSTTGHPQGAARSVRQFDYIAEMMQLALDDTPVLKIKGRVTQVIGTIIKAVVPTVKVGEVCVLRNPGEDFEMKAEVVGFARDAALLTPIGDMYGISAATEVIPTGRAHMVPVGFGLLGRVLDGLGRPLDEAERGPLEASKFYPVFAEAPDPLKRKIISQPLELGVRVLDSVLTCGEGQRMGIFAAAGGGKSTLMGMLVKGADVDVTVVALIGERGREVRDFVETTLGEEGLRRAVVVAAPADRPPLARLHGAYRATAIAEWFRDQGLNVLLLMDSLTRFAQAQREIGLSVGEPPTTRGYPPSVFAKLPALVERAGNGAAGRGSITAFYTVLTEGDDPQDPIADAARAILDGHILLSRRIADAGLYPAIDVESSVSRVVQDIADETWRERIRALKRLVAAYNSNRDLIAIGAYQRGNDPVVDEALERWPEIVGFLGQDVARAADLEHSRGALADLLQRNRAQHKENAA